MARITVLISEVCSPIPASVSTKALVPCLERNTVRPPSGASINLEFGLVVHKRGPLGHEKQRRGGLAGQRNAVRDLAFFDTNHVQAGAATRCLARSGMATLSRFPLC